jgi:hypothetical protein
MLLHHFQFSMEFLDHQITYPNLPVT